MPLEGSIPVAAHITERVLVLSETTQTLNPPSRVFHQIQEDFKAVLKVIMAFGVLSVHK